MKRALLLTLIALAACTSPETPARLLQVTCGEAVDTATRVWQGAAVSKQFAYETVGGQRVTAPKDVCIIRTLGTRP